MQMRKECGKIPKMGYIIRKQRKENRKGVLKSNSFDKAIKQIARNLQQTGSLDVKQDVLCVLTQWIDYVRELKAENERMETLKKNCSLINKIYHKMNKRIEVLEKQWDLLQKDDQSLEESH
ncbi:uncharacterized protein LOC133188983 [Saccostrea echinata]|uniref:uncharacterized protein LOC133188983 n=1 Tax=Saccostrea echinata TaxID=191078 RepID=UPI002A818FE9|nr:uncharacterized protein LOC133188983 [Saccostrea echinata]